MKMYVAIVVRSSWYLPFCPMLVYASLSEGEATAFAVSENTKELSPFLYPRVCLSEMLALDLDEHLYVQDLWVHRFVANNDDTVHFPASSFLIKGNEIIFKRGVRGRRKQQFHDTEWVNVSFNHSYYYWGDIALRQNEPVGIFRFSERSWFYFGDNTVDAKTLDFKKEGVLPIHVGPIVQLCLDLAKRPKHANAIPMRTISRDELST